jgi:hypothetical protein
VKPSRRALIAFVIVAAPVLAFGARMRLFEVRTVNGFVFDAMVESNMGLSNGLTDAYDGCYMLRVSKGEVRIPSVAILFGGKGIQSPRSAHGDLSVSRQLYVDTDEDWARYYDLVINTSKSVQTAEVEIFGNLGSDSSTKLVDTSDGDALIETSDTWIATDDYADGAGDPSLAHVFRREASKLQPTAVTLQLDDFSVRYEVKLAPGARAAFVLFAVQTKSGAEAVRIARELTKFGPSAKRHLAAADIAAIRN